MARPEGRRDSTKANARETRPLKEAKKPARANGGKAVRKAATLLRWLLVDELLISAGRLTPLHSEALRHELSECRSRLSDGLEKLLAMDVAMEADLHPTEGRVDLQSRYKVMEQVHLVNVTRRGIEKDLLMMRAFPGGARSVNSRRC